MKKMANSIINNVQPCMPEHIKKMLLMVCNISNTLNLFHVKITSSVTKCLYQDCGLCYLHLPIFSYT